jgi:hypothetical protein
MSMFQIFTVKDDTEHCHSEYSNINPLSPFSGELTRDYCVTSYRRKMTDTREYPQYFVKKG